MLMYDELIDCILCSFCTRLIDNIYAILFEY